MPPECLLHAALSRSIIGAFYEVYNVLGAGFLEHLYVRAVERELLRRDHSVAREVSAPVIYKGELLGVQRLDMVIDGKIVIEVKSTAQLHRNAARQLYNYLRATNLELGLLLYFGPKPAFFRVISTNNRNLPPHPLDP